jgi:cytochrome c nitrite reductase small subunit
MAGVTGSGRGSQAFIGGWQLLALSALLGGVLGLGGFTMVHARGFSYISDDPQACANCHVMRDVFNGWNHSSHKAVAVCNDCHTPHDFISKYAVKAINGWNHSAAFTTGNFPDPIRINAMNRSVALNNCFYCHSDLVAAMGHDPQGEPTNCLACHENVGHQQ